MFSSIKDVGVVRATVRKDTASVLQVDWCVVSTANVANAKIAAAIWKRNKRKQVRNRRGKKEGEWSLESWCYKHCVVLIYNSYKSVKGYILL